VIRSASATAGPGREEADALPAPQATRAPQVGQAPQAGRQAQASPPLRADAERNRERVLVAAEQLFAERGLDTPLEDIAERAGVGIATLYRRFPTRGDLIAAALERKIASYTDVIKAALANPDPWAGFCEVILRMCELQVSDAGLKELFTVELPKPSAMDELMAEARANLEELVVRAREQGTLRPDFDAVDIPVTLIANAGLVTATHRTAPDAWRRFAAYQLQAFRADRDVPLPLPDPPAYDQIERSMSPDD
jgi:AcrR family transcriptional regulator